MTEHVSGYSTETGDTEVMIRLSDGTIYIRQTIKSGMLTVDQSRL